MPQPTKTYQSASGSESAIVQFLEIIFGVVEQVVLIAAPIYFAAHVLVWAVK